MSAAARMIALLDARIGHAAAEIAVHVRDDFFLGRIAVLGEQRCGLHDLAGLAVAALRNLLGDPGPLQRMFALGLEAFDGGDLLAGGLADTAVWQERTASPLRWTVQAPHKPAPQPNFVPVICRCSRMTHNSGVSFGTSTE